MAWWRAAIVPQPAVCSSTAYGSVCLCKWDSALVPSSGMTAVTLHMAGSTLQLLIVVLESL